MIWEVEVEVKVRKTLKFGGPIDKLTAERTAKDAAHNINMLRMLSKVEPDTQGYYVAVEVVIDNDPRVVSVKEISS